MHGPYSRYLTYIKVMPSSGPKPDRRARREERMSGRWIVAILAMAVSNGALADPVKILFLGNSYTHGRYTPALNYNAGPGDNAGSALVHDLLCPSLPCTGAEGPAPVVPTTANVPGNTLAAKLTYLEANPSHDYTEV